MKTFLILLHLLVFGLTLFGQTATQNIFNHLPLDKSVEQINKILQKDTANYKVIKVNNNAYYYTLKPDSFFDIFPETSEITAYYFKPANDSVYYPVLLRFITISKKNNSSKKISKTYNQIVDVLKKEYEYSKSEYLKGTRKEKNKKTTIDEWTTYFYDKKGDPRCRFSIAWFDEGRYGHEFIMNYNLSECR